MTVTAGRAAVMLGGAIVVGSVAFALQWTRGAPSTEVAAVTAAPVGASLELARQVAELERRLAAAEQRLAASQEQVLQLQVFVQRLELTSAAPAGSPEASATVREAGRLAGHTTSTYPERPVLVQAGDDEAAVRARHGAPGEVVVREDGGRTLRYWQEGLVVELQPDGRVKEAVFIGTPTGVQRDANGNSNAFSADGRWYRPSRWSLHGLKVGDPGVDVVARLGDPDSNQPDANGVYALYYARLDAVFFITSEPDCRLFKIRVGGGGARADADGNVR